MRFPVALTAFAALAFAGCAGEPDAPAAARNAEPAAPPRFALVAPEESGIDFANRVSEGPAINYFNYGYIYNGGGVAVLDYDRDGRPDLYFSGTMVPNRLYRNLGGFRFEDVTATAGVAADRGFKTGVVAADVNADGWPDLLACRTGNGPVEERGNLLYVNNGDGTFTERSVEYGIGSPANTNHAVFFDYDGDGDLDLYELNHPIRFGANTRPRLRGGVRYTLPETPYESDRLFRNDGGRFTDVSGQAGIVNSAFGLSVSVHDFDGDGHEDVFVANDYVEPDLLYRNNGNGTFTDVAAEVFGQMSQNSMGSDAADLNEDGRPDLVVLDMLPETDERQKALMSTMMLDRYRTLLDLGYGRQQMRNVVQLGNGRGFSEVGRWSGVDATDWSWAPLAVDLDQDGRKDLLVTNGYRRDVTDLDFIKYKNDSLRRDMPMDQLYRVLERIPAVKLRNHAYRQRADGTFTDVGAAWGLRAGTFSNGAAVADLDGDGDLDLVVNNLEEPAHLYRNDAPDGHALRVRLEGDGANPMAVGARVEVEAGGRVVHLHQQPVRGYFSSIDPVLHAGLGDATVVDEVRVRWPSGRWTRGGPFPADTLVVLRPDGEAFRPEGENPAPLFRPVDGPVFVHAENAFEDLKREFLLLRRLSREGPRLLVADLDADGLDDLAVGGAAGQPGMVFLQTATGGFRGTVPACWRADAASEDGPLAALDANGDGHADLYVASAGYAFAEGDPRYADRLYLGDGRGGFTAAPAGTLPELPRVPTGAVAAGDADGDGDTDLFVGGRAVPGRYPTLPPSALLINEGGRFTDATAALAPELRAPGMLTDAVFADLDGDGTPELALAGEWMAPAVYRRRGGGPSAEGPLWTRSEQPALAQLQGWWETLLPVDADGDGDLDLVAGNLGTNGRFRPSPAAPMVLLAKDFDGNGQIDPVPFHTVDGQLKPAHAFDLMAQQLPYLRKRFHRYGAYARAGLDEVFPPAEQQGAQRLECRTLAHHLLRNDGSGRLVPEALPAAAQQFPLRAALAGEWTGDGRTDLLLAGNFAGPDTESGPITAGTGLLLEGTDAGWTPRPSARTGFYASGEVRALAAPRRADGTQLVVVATSDGPLATWAWRPPASALP